MSVIPFPGTKKSGGAGRIERLTLPVAPQAVCRLQSAGDTPSVKALPPTEAVAWIAELFKGGKEIAAVDLRGPGDALATPALTLETLSLLRQSYPDLQLQVSTLGFGSAAIADELAKQRVALVNLEVVARELEGIGVGAFTMPPTYNFDPETLTADWSHKHAAFIAGLGTFGLHKMIITEKGCAGRLGSFLINAEIAPSPKPFFEYCLYKYNKSCRKCVTRCTFHSLKEDSYDRFACYDILKQNNDRFGHLGPSDVCGKCAAIVPCSFENPVK
jgi:hypothetical protein